ncbi:zinc finger protein 841-like [Protopterus annectens]|uniref:zinc finger protein 841-like n=1 Tax=Protopterus annectens TaxID=7888 RepID=UPI001CF993C2|nr:zinc finger protein 841-like [Protopterus annectens]
MTIVESTGILDNNKSRLVDNNENDGGCSQVWGDINYDESNEMHKYVEMHDAKDEVDIIDLMNMSTHEYINNITLVGGMIYGVQGSLFNYTCVEEDLAGQVLELENESTDMNVNFYINLDPDVYCEVGNVYENTSNLNFNKTIDTASNMCAVLSHPMIIENEVGDFKLYNYSKISMNEKQVNLFSKGFNFVLCRKGDLVKSIMELKMFTRKLNLKTWFNMCPDDENLYRQKDRAPKRASAFNPPMNDQIAIFERLSENDMRKFYRTYKNLMHHNMSKEEYETFNSIRNESSIRIMKPDKGNGVVVTTTQDYISYMIGMLQGDSYEEVSLNEINIAYAKIDLTIKNMLHKGEITEDEYNYMNNEYPVISGIFGIPKIHKGLDNLQFRPIVDGKRNKTCFISQFLDYHLKKCLTKFPYISKDSWDFLAKIKELKMNEGDSFITVDVCNLFTTIPQDIGLIWLEEQLHETKLFDQDRINMLVNLMEIVLMNNYIYYEGNYYQQINGVAMGASCAPIYANLIMSYWEVNYIFKTEYFEHIKLYTRYLDDIFIVWDERKDMLESFIGYINNTVRFLKFTHEISEKEITYLDVRLTYDKECVNRNADFSKFKSQWSSCGKCLHLECDKAVSETLSITRHDPLLTGSKHNFVKKNEDVLGKSELEMQDETVGEEKSCTRNNCCSSMFTLHSGKRDDNTSTTNEQIISRKTVPKCVMGDTDSQLVPNGQMPCKCTICDKSFTDDQSFAQHQVIHTALKPYKCSMCDKSFRHKSNMVAHQLIHSGQKPYKCTICAKSFTRKSTVVTHQLIHTGQKPYKCTQCDKSFSRRSTLVSHQITHSGQKPYKCTICDKSFRYKNTLVRHQSIHTGLKPHKLSVRVKGFTQKGNMIRHYTHTKQKPYKCTTCDKSFIYKRSVLMHHLLHTGQTPYKCNKCNKGFTNKIGLAVHEIIHTGQKPYKCRMCEKSFRYKITLESHQSIHTGQKPYKCALCDKDFLCKRSLTAHESIHAGLKPFRCAICDKGFMHKRSVAVHQVIHTGEKPFKCATCNKGFTQKYSLEKHKYIHADQKPYKCGICDKGFTRKATLVKHEYIHSEQKPYKCVICDKGFAHKSNLIQHQFVHSEQKPYTCSICDKGFAKKSNMIEHQYIHSEQKPFKCATCGMEFTLKSNMEKHQYIHSEEKPYKCTACDKSFMWKSRLASHEFVHSKQTPYKCSTCDKGFRDRGSLTRHQITHTGHKPYKCATCGMDFTLKSNMEKHQYIHTGHQPYKCTMCDKGFRDKTSLTAHENKHSGLRPYKCPICHKGFTCKRILKGHQLIHAKKK